MGNPGRRPIPPDAVEPPAASAEDMREPPAELGEFGAEHWRELAPRLIEAGILTDLDWPVFLQLCEAWQQWQENGRQVARTGGPIIRGKDPNNPASWQWNPYVHLEERGRKAYHRLATEFGMTPSSRTKVRDARPKRPRSIKEQLGAGSAS